MRLTTPMLTDHVRARRADGTGPATVMNDLIWIGVVLRAAKGVKELPVSPEMVQAARNACRELRLIGRARERSRRATPDGLAQLRRQLASRDRHAQIPMQAIMEFAIACARREAENCRLEWREKDKGNCTGPVCDAKHPTARDGNHRRFKYTPRPGRSLNDGRALRSNQTAADRLSCPALPRPSMDRLIMKSPSQ